MTRPPTLKDTEFRYRTFHIVITDTDEKVIDIFDFDRQETPVGLVAPRRVCRETGSEYDAGDRDLRAKRVHTPVCVGVSLARLEVFLGCLRPQGRKPWLCFTDTSNA